MAYHGIEDLGFYGLGSEDEVEELRQALETLRRLYHGSHFIADITAVRLTERCWL